MPAFKTFTLTVAALLAFAANSILCRLALKDGSMDAMSFALIRVLSAALVLLLLLYWRGVSYSRGQRSWWGSVYLTVYLLGFSLSYVILTTANGALLLFGSVQLTMLVVALGRGEKLHSVQLIGAGLALLGFVWLLWPGLDQPQPMAALQMVVAGVGWGLYTLTGQGSTDALADTRNHFMRAVVLMGIATLVIQMPVVISSYAVFLAILSGVLASAGGYVLWYLVLTRLTTITAAVSQLTVPLLVALLSVVIVQEPLSWRFAVAAVGILAGLGLVMLRSK
ncbi:DMT family transporter [Marinicella sp. W31]|uniref:DMT family transporter n=1 Tax=Marinicella sp. W31 TaxID=3023713 RepID=UPI003756373E